MFRKNELVYFPFFIHSLEWNSIASVRRQYVVPLLDRVQIQLADYSVQIAKSTYRHEKGTSK